MLSQPRDNDCCCVGASETDGEKITVSFIGRSKPEPDAPVPLTSEITSSVMHNYLHFISMSLQP